MKKYRIYPEHGDTRFVEKFVIRKTLPPTRNVSDYKGKIPEVTRTLEKGYIEQVYDGDKGKWLNSNWADINLTDIIEQKQEKEAEQENV